jgi:AraC family transcriptional regulator
VAQLEHESIADERPLRITIDLSAPLHGRRCLFAGSVVRKVNRYAGHLRDDSVRRMPMSHSTRTFDCSDEVSVSLSHYKPRGTQKLHAHSFTQISFLLSGEMKERQGHADWTPDVATFGRKPAGLLHENEWGRNGALIFSIKLRGAIEAEEALAPAGWFRPVNPSSLPQLVRACLENGEACAQEDAVWDLLSLCHGGDVRRVGSPPNWLRIAKEALDDAPVGTSIAEIARCVGVHRSHLSSSFRSFFNVSPSVYRREAMLARALFKVVDSDSRLTSVAHEAGFSDQAHLSRAVRKATGLTPRFLRSSLR